MKRQLVRMKNPKFTPAEEKRIAQAEKCCARATLLELGAGVLLKDEPYRLQIEVVIEALQESMALRAESDSIHGSVGRRGRGGRPMRPKVA